MSSGSSTLPPERVPTLTEVVAWPQPAPLASGDPQLPAVDARPARAETLARPMPPLRGSEEQLIQSVLAEIQNQVELMLEYRLREMLTPLLNRAADSIVREARTELASTLRDVVSRAVTQEVARRRTR